MWAIRKKRNLKTNKNLYQVFILPHIRALYPLMDLVKESERKTVEALTRSTFKSFCIIPKGTPNQITNKLIGDTSIII